MVAMRVLEARASCVWVRVPLSAPSLKASGGERYREATGGTYPWLVEGFQFLECRLLVNPACAFYRALLLLGRATVSLFRVLSSAVEHLVYTERGGGSTPSGRTKHRCCKFATRKLTVIT